MWVMSLLGDPKNSSAGPALEFWGSPKRDHQNSSKDLRTSQMRSPPPFFSSFCNTRIIAFLLQSLRLLCCAFLLCTDFPLHLHLSGRMSYGRIVSLFQIVCPEHVCYGDSQQKGSEPHHICQVRILNPCCLYRLFLPLYEVAPENLVWKHALTCIKQQLA